MLIWYFLNSSFNSYSGSNKATQNILNSFKPYTIM